MTLSEFLAWLNENKEWLLTIPATVIGWFAIKKLHSQRSDRGSVNLQGDGTQSKIHTAHASDGSTVTQVESVIINQGVITEQVESIALKTFDENFVRLFGEAEVIAQNRAQVFTRDLVAQIEKSNPETLEKICDPEFAASVFEAQKRYAVSGDKDLHATLIRLLIDLADAPPRSMRQISIKEAINCSAKITATQMDILALIFVARHVRWEVFYTASEIAKFADDVVAPFLGGGAADYSNYSHLSSLGCLEIGPGAHDIVVFFMTHWRTALTKGIPKKEIESLDDGTPGFWDMFESIKESDNLFQLSAQTNELINERANILGIDDKLKRSIIGLDAKHLLDGADRVAFLRGLHPEIKRLWTIWTIPNSALPRAHLNPLGIVLAHARMPGMGAAPGPLSAFVSS